MATYHTMPHHYNTNLIQKPPQPPHQTPPRPSKPLKSLHTEDIFSSIFESDIDHQLQPLLSRYLKSLVFASNLKIPIAMLKTHQILSKRNKAGMKKIEQWYISMEHNLNKFLWDFGKKIEDLKYLVKCDASDLAIFDSVSREFVEGFEEETIDLNGECLKTTFLDLFKALQFAEPKQASTGNKGSLKVKCFTSEERQMPIPSRREKVSLII